MASKQSKKFSKVLPEWLQNISVTTKGVHFDNSVPRLLSVFVPLFLLFVFELNHKVIESI